LIGLNLKKKFPELKWIADFRDPWTEISYYKHLKLTNRSDKKHRFLESEVFKNADITLATSYTDAENFRKNGANAFCITNGFDETDSPQTHKKSTHQTKFTLSYIGVLEQLRNPENLWEALDYLVKANPDFAENFCLKFVGRIDDKIIDKIEKSGLKNHIFNLGYVSHDKAVEEMANSSLLLITNFPNDSSKGIIPGKIFEYLATGKQIISFGPNEADVAKILDETKAGKHFSYNDSKKIEDFILDKFELWKNGNIAENKQSIEQFSRRNLAKQLSEIL
jgi:glycosyltransferase involved in cell wall biosynthesis